jgi:hypothetical protein
MHVRRLLVLCGAMLMLVACGGVVDPSKNKVDTFSGTLQPQSGGSTNVHFFSVSKNGEVTFTMTSVTPAPVNAGTLIFSLGQPSSGSCQLFPGQAQAAVVNRGIQFYPFANGLINKGDYCLAVIDLGIITVATSYTGNISHP